MQNYEFSVQVKRLEPLGVHSTKSTKTLMDWLQLPRDAESVYAPDDGRETKPEIGLIACPFR